MLNFLKDVFTVKTVWIDMGEGRWAVRKRLHPVMRLMLLCAVIGVSGLAYLTFFAADNVPGDISEAAVSEEPSPADSTDDTASSPADDADTAQPAEDEQPSEEPDDTELQSTDEPDDPAEQTETDAPEVTEPSEEPKAVSEPRRRQEKRGRNRRRIEQSADSVPYDGLYREPTSEDEAAAVTSRPQAKSEFRIVIRKNDYTLDVFDGREFVKSYDIAVGRNAGNKQRVGDNRTPTGKFTVRSIENSTEWSHDFGDGKGIIKNAYGPWFIRLNAGRWKGIGIHGTHAPESIGTMATEGCIRLNNSDLRELKRNYVFRGMKVEIRE